MNLINKINLKELFENLKIFENYVFYEFFILIDFFIIAISHSLLTVHIFLLKKTFLSEQVNSNLGRDHFFISEIVWEKREGKTTPNLAVESSKILLEI